jgi:hypothetical protein
MFRKGYAFLYWGDENYMLFFALPIDTGAENVSAVMGVPPLLAICLCHRLLTPAMCLALRPHA